MNRWDLYRIVWWAWLLCSAIFEFWNQNTKIQKLTRKNDLKLLPNSPPPFHVFSIRSLVCTRGRTSQKFPAGQYSLLYWGFMAPVADDDFKIYLSVLKYNCHQVVVLWDFILKSNIHYSLYLDELWAVSYSENQRLSQTTTCRYYRNTTDYRDSILISIIHSGVRPVQPTIGNRHRLTNCWNEYNWFRTMTKSL